MDEKTMTEWEKLCEELTQSLERQEFMISKSTPHKWRQVKAVGDKLKEKADKYDEVEFLVIEINGETDDIVHLSTLLKQKQKLEAIRMHIKGFPENQVLPMRVMNWLVALEKEVLDGE